MKKNLSAPRPLAAIEADLAAEQSKLDLTSLTSRDLLLSVEHLRKLANPNPLTVVAPFALNKGGEVIDEGRTFRALRDEVDSLPAKAAWTLSIIEASEDYRIAMEDIQPLIDRTAELQCEALEARQRRGDAERALEEAKAQATARATEAAASCPEVEAAKQALATL